MWLHGKSIRTADYYRRSALRFLEFVGKPIHLITLAEVQGFALSLAEKGLSASTQRTIMAAVKSLLSFGVKIEVLSKNVGAPVVLPSAPDTLSERLLSEIEVLTIIDSETEPRNRALLRLLYYGGLRVSELCALKWKNLAMRDNKGQVTVYGKGGKTRTVLVPASLWVELMRLRGDAELGAPVFCSQKKSHDGHGHLTREWVHKIVQAAAKRAGISGKISPHSLRHAHASHALERGAKIHLVQATLGHSSVAVTSRYLHARPEESSGLYLPT
ncbi:MAG: tyrosine-type recombinase/integrase [Gloeocapsa sp. UFS-A4-WI-NPMV-4B04]|nr:tyrosine-type recombinase/integrase [Gloeocapsa sp. UFS-A4-WI-NPMV-4B04]